MIVESEPAAAGMEAELMARARATARTAAKTAGASGHRRQRLSRRSRPRVSMPHPTRPQSAIVIIEQIRNADNTFVQSPET